MNTFQEAPTILVVDDEHALADTIAEIMRRAGYNSSAVYSATEALEVLETAHPALIISDVMMPGMNGVDFAVQVYRSHRDIKVLLISGHAGTRDLVEAAEATGYSLDLLAKPVAPQELLDTVAGLLNKSPRAGTQRERIA